MSDFQRFVIQLVVTLPGVIVCSRLIRGIRERGGRVVSTAFGWPDLLLAFFLCGVFALIPLSASLASRAVAAEVKVPGRDALVMNFIVFGGFIGVIWASLRWRQLSPVQLFGFRRLALWRAVLIGILIIAAVFPLLGTLSTIVQGLLQEAAKEQEVVTMFRKTQESGDQGAIALMAFTAVIFQPFVEEYLFRGYLYGVFKGWSGPIASAIFTATLFATIHMSLAALLPLLILALILTLAYEWSGTLWVPIAMHMTFNGVQLAIMTWLPQLAGQ